MEVSWITCATKGCGYSPFPMEKAFEQRAHRTHETFHCPAGHSLSFKGESDHEREVRILRERLTGARNRADRLWGELEEARRTCPWVACDVIASSRQGLSVHLIRTHGMPTVSEVADVA